MQGFGKLAHGHAAMLTIFTQALSQITRSEEGGCSCEALECGLRDGEAGAFAQRRSRRAIEIIRLAVQDASELHDPISGNATASVFETGDRSRCEMRGFRKLAHGHAAMLAIFTQALSDLRIDGPLPVHVC